MSQWITLLLSNTDHPAAPSCRGRNEGCPVPRLGELVWPPPCCPPPLNSLRSTHILSPPPFAPCPLRIASSIYIQTSFKRSKWLAEFPVSSHHVTCAAQLAQGPQTWFQDLFIHLTLINQYLWRTLPGNKPNTAGQQRYQGRLHRAGPRPCLLRGPTARVRSQNASG